jgi:OmpA-OmpF porin, OOP family
MAFKSVWGVGGLALMTVAASVSAQDSANRTIERMGRPVYVAPMLNFTIDDSDRATKNGYGASFGIGTRVLPWLAAEVHASYTRFNDEDEVFTGINTNSRSYSANVLAFPFRGGFRNLFVLAGAGYNDVSSHPETVGNTLQLRSYDSTVYDLGVGMLSGFRLFGNPASMRLETKYRFDDHGIDTLGTGRSSDFGDVVISAGLMIPLFYSPRHPRRPLLNQKSCQRWPRQIPTATAYPMTATNAPTHRLA